MGIVIVDGQEIEIGDEERLNGIQVAKRAGVEVPHYCWHPGLSVVASCRMCLVETGTLDAETGETRMLPKLVPACQTPAKDGAVFITNSEKIEQARAFVEEGLLINHPIDCPICDKAGECHLQDYHFEHGQKSRRADVRPFTSRRREMGKTVTLFVDRCVMCTRCVRFTREISGTSELFVLNRGAAEEIDIFPGAELDNKLSGNVVDLCPVGALGDKDFLYSQRVWFMKKHAGVCTGCSTGCSIYTEENQNRVHRLKPRENPHVNQWWMCDEGRYGFHHVHNEKRLIGAQRRDGQEYVDVEWSPLLSKIGERLNAVDRMAAVLSPHLTVEEAFLLAKYARGIDPQAVLVTGPIPMVGEDEKFPNGFTIHAEKCPNRRGVEEIVRHFSGEVHTFDELPGLISERQLQAVWLSGGYKTDWIDEPTAEALGGVELLVVEDTFDSPAWQRAAFRLPGVTFAERDGCYVNHADRLQYAEWAVRPPVGARSAGSMLWQLLGQAGLYNARSVLDETAATIAYFEPATQDVPASGVQLKAPSPEPATAAS